MYICVSYIVVCKFDTIFLNEKRPFKCSSTPTSGLITIFSSCKLSFKLLLYRENLSYRSLVQLETPNKCPLLSVKIIQAGAAIII